MRMMLFGLTLLSAGSFFTLSALPMDVSNSVPKLLDKYECSGTWAEGRYQSSLTVKPMGKNYVLYWPEVESKGMGFRSGNDLSIAFITSHGKIGTLVYRISEGTLIGRWTTGDGEVYAESCMVGTPA